MIVKSFLLKIERKGGVINRTKRRLWTKKVYMKLNNRGKSLEIEKGYTITVTVYDRSCLPILSFPCNSRGTVLVLTIFFEFLLLVLNYSFISFPNHIWVVQHTTCLVPFCINNTYLTGLYRKDTFFLLSRYLSQKVDSIEVEESD